MSLFDDFLKKKGSASKQGASSKIHLVKHKKVVHDTHSYRFSLLNNFKKSLTTVINLRDAVVCPKGEKEESWISMNVLECYNEILLQWESIGNFCTDDSCPKMIASPKYEFYWQDKDDKEFVKPAAVSAPRYVDLLFTWVEKKTQDEKLFPLTNVSSFPKTFYAEMRSILKRLSRVYMHLFCHHGEQISQLEGAAAQLRTTFKHLYYLSTHFKLLKDEDFAPVTIIIADF